MKYAHFHAHVLNVENGDLRGLLTLVPPYTHRAEGSRRGGGRPPPGRAGCQACPMKCLSRLIVSAQRTSGNEVSGSSFLIQSEGKSVCARSASRLLRQSADKQATRKRRIRTSMRGRKKKTRSSMLADKAINLRRALTLIDDAIHVLIEKNQRLSERARGSMRYSPHARWNKHRLDSNHHAAHGV